MTAKLLASLILASCASGCGFPTAVRGYFNTQGYTYPVHLNLPARAEPTIVCPGCPEPERPGPEYEQLLLDGRQFLSTHLTAEFLQPLTSPEAEAFLVSNVFLLEDGPGAPIALAVHLSAFSNAAATDGEIYIPHESHNTKAGEVLELRNILVLRRTGDDWEYSGWMY